MNIKFSLIILIMLSTLYFSFCEKWYKTDLNMIDTTSDNEYRKDTISDLNNNRIVVKYKDNLSDGNVRLIEKTLSVFTGWETVKYELIKFSISDNYIEIVLLPDSFFINERNIMKNIPGGMIFYIKTGLEYDFRISSGEYFLRIKGVYINKSELLLKLEDAILNPENYIERHDPEYYLAKINKLTIMSENSQKDISLLKKYLVNKDNIFVKVPDNIIDEITNIKNNNISYSVNEISDALTKSGFKVSSSQIKAVLKIFYNE